MPHPFDSQPDADHLPVSVTRREALRRTAVSAMAIASGACLGSTEPKTGSGDGRLAARASAPSHTTEPGLYQLSLGSSRDGLLYVPTSYRPGTPAPLALMLHGAGQDASELVTPVRSRADANGLVLVGVDSRGVTWDAIRGVYSDDVQFIDRALALAFSRVRVDAARVRIAGFSDGGTYSLSLGRINGDLFSRVAAFSPGFIVDGPPNGKPRFFITHGTRDTILPIDSTSRAIVPALERAGYEVEYHEFDGGHTITPALLDQAVAWLAA